MSHKVNKITLYSKLLERSNKKITPSSNGNILPKGKVDFREYFENIVPKDLENPNYPARTNMPLHYQKLRFAARGKPEVIPFNMLLISYLRRDTQYTAQALKLFERLWNEHVEELVEIIPTRDLVSTFRTFADHSTNPKRRLLGKLAFMYGHMIKLYETERYHEGLPYEKAGYSIPQKNPRIGLKKLWGVRFGGDNSFEIVNVLMAEEIAQDDVLGTMILELLSRYQAGHTIFSRFDQARIASSYNIESDREWSFGLDPSKPHDEADELA